MKDYTKFMKWAVFSIIDRSTQDDRTSKVHVSALFNNPVQIEDCFDPPNKEIKYYILRVNELERFEKFYNHIQDIKEEYGDDIISHINDNNQWSIDELDRFCYVLNVV